MRIDHDQFNCRLLGNIVVEDNSHVLSLFFNFKASNDTLFYASENVAGTHVSLAAAEIFVV